MAIFYGIVLIPCVCCSCRCTLSLYNAFTWTVSVKAGQSELNEARVRPEHMNAQTPYHHATFLNLYIDFLYTTTYCCTLMYKVHTIIIIIITFHSHSGNLRHLDVEILPERSIVDLFMINLNKVLKHMANGK